MIDDRDSLTINFIENNVKSHLIRTTFYIINSNDQNIFSIQFNFVFISKFEYNLTFYYNLIILTTLNTMSTFVFENNMNFTNYNNVFCKIYSIENEIHTFCIDIDSKSSLISKSCFEKCYSNFFTYFMFNNKRLRYNDIKFEFVIFNRYVNIFFRFRNYDKNYIIIQNEMHIISKLFCDMIVKITILKFNNMIIH